MLILGRGRCGDPDREPTSFAGKPPPKGDSQSPGASPTRVLRLLRRTNSDGRVPGDGIPVPAPRRHEPSDMSPDEIEQHRRRVLDDQAAVMRAIGVEWPPVDESPNAGAARALRPRHAHRTAGPSLGRAGGGVGGAACPGCIDGRRNFARLAPSSVLLLTSRVYLLMRLLGRWGWLEHRIRRALW